MAWKFFKPDTTDVTLAYVEGSSNITISSNSEPSPNDIIVAPPLTFDGRTKIMIEFYAPMVETSTTSGAYTGFTLWDSGVQLGRLNLLRTPAAAATGISVYAKKILTPSAGTHTFKVGGWSTAGTNGYVYMSPGGPTAAMPGFLKVTALEQIPLQVGVADTIIDTTVAGLGAGVHGQQAALRLGSSPYDLIGLLYDSTIGKWVSQPVPIINAYPAAADTTTSATFAVVTGAGNVAYYPFFKRAYDAGLRPQLQIVAILAASAGTPTAALGMGIDEMNDGDTATTELGTIEGSVFDSGGRVLSTTPEYLATDWLTASMNAPAKNHATLTLQAKTTSGTLSVYAYTYRMRWTSV